MAGKLPYPPPYQDIETLCLHLCIHPNTVDSWVKHGLLPAPKMVGGKRLWRWTEVQKHLDGEEPGMSPVSLAERIRHATKQAASGR